MVKAPKRVLIWGCILGLGLLCAPCAQEPALDLLLKPEDLFLENKGDIGLHLFIRKKPDIASVMLMESAADPTGREPVYAYRSLEWNPVNGDEQNLNTSGQGAYWSLLDSSPESHPFLGEAFHIFIPQMIVYGIDGGRWGTVIVGDGMYINIRTFPLPYADPSEGFEDNPFTLKYSSTGNPPALRQNAASTPPDTPSFLPPDREPETLKTREAAKLKPPDEALTDEPRTDGIRTDTVRTDTVRTDAVRSPPEKEPFVIDARFGYRVFIPGPGGMLLPSLPLANTYNPVGAVALSRRFNKALGFVLELERESFSLNRMVVRAAWDTGVVGIEAGPSMGIFNTETLDISPGLSLMLSLSFPAWNLSGSFRFDSALGREPSAPGDYTQSYASASVSYAFPWVKITLGMAERGSTVVDSQGIPRVGRWIRYNLAAEFPAAPASWGFRTELGYEQLHWNYKLSMPLKYRYFAVYTGLEASYTVLPDFLTLIAGLEGPVYPFVYPALIQSLDDPQEAFYGRITLGFRLSLR
jgi:hypothetical protein